MAMFSFEFLKNRKEIPKQGEAAEVTPDEEITIPPVPDLPAERVSTEGITVEEGEIEEIKIGDVVGFAQMYPKEWGMIMHQLAIHLTEALIKAAKAKGYRAEMKDEAIEKALAEVLAEPELAEGANRFLIGWQESMRKMSGVEFEEMAARDLFGLVRDTELAGKVLERMYKH